MNLTNVFTEEGRTRLRNAARRYAFYALLWLAASLLAGYCTYSFYVAGNLTPMQRVYFNEYAKSAWRSSVKNVLPLVSKSTYLVLVREVEDPRTGRRGLFDVTEDEAVAILDERGRVALTPDGLPRFALRDGISHTRFFWLRTFDNDSRRYEVFRKGFFEGQDFAKMLAPSLTSALSLFVLGLSATVAADLLYNRRYLRGQLLRGPRRLSPKEYARAFRADGLGIRVRAVE